MIYVQPKELSRAKSNQSISKTLKVFFIIIQTIFLFDFGFVGYKSTRVKLVIKTSLAILSLILAIYSIRVVCSEMELFDIVWQSTLVLEKCVYIIILLAIPEPKTFFKFLENLRQIDSEMNANDSSDYLDIKIILWCITSCIFKSLSTISYCTYFDNACVSDLFTLIIISINYVSLDIPLVILYFVFYAARLRLVTLRKITIEEKLKPKQAQLLYKSLIDLVENFKEKFDPIFVTALLANIPTIMMTIYLTVKDLKSEKIDPFGYVNECVASTLLIVANFAPAIAAESLSTEVDKIKISLQDMLLEDKDEDQEQDIKNFSNYIEARPFKFRVLQIIPLDATFPVVVLNICVTYLIVTLQLTHIY